MKRFIILILTVIMLTSMCACSSSDDTPVDVSELYVPTYEDNAKIPILSEMPPDFSVRNNFEQYIESGMNTILIGEDYFKFGSQAFETVMAWCEEENIDAFVRMSKSYVKPQQTDVSNPVRYPTYFELTYPDLDFKNYPAIKGFALCDEPSYKQVLELRASYLPWFNENYGNGHYKFYNNFFTGQSAMIGNDLEGQAVKYDDYATFYIENVLLHAQDDGSKIFSHDTYPLQKINGELITQTGYLNANFHTAAYCKKYGLSMATYIQAFEGYSNTVLPASAAEVKFLMYTDVAFGSRQFMYFGYKETRDAGLFYPMMTNGGVPNPLYYYVQEANREIAKFDHVLLAFNNWQGIYTFVGTGNKLSYSEHFDAIEPHKSQEEIAKTLRLNSLTDVSAFKSKYNSFVGEFKDADGRTGFLLQNFDDRSLTRSNKVKMTFENADGVLYYRKGEPVIQGLANHKFEIELDMCEGIFIIPLYKQA